jgi:hypothetical protein
MPVLLLGNKGAYLRNNGRGQDIYVMELDNMPCLVPDSTFTSNMPRTDGLKKHNSIARP